MTGEMGKRDVTPDAFPLHFAIARALIGSSVHPFDVYQGPYILYRGGNNGHNAKLWVSSDDGSLAYVYNERNDRKSETFEIYGPDAAEMAVEMAKSVVFPDVTPVVFRKWKRKHAGDGIVAIFPDQTGDSSVYTCGSYEHVGQHGACHPVHIYTQTTAATPDEYADLKAELESAPYHYNLRVMTRINHEHYLKIRKAALSRNHPGE
jgi:hypothetical protein